MDYLVIIRFAAGHSFGRHSNRELAVKAVTKEINEFARGLGISLKPPMPAGLYLTDDDVYWDQRGVYRKSDDSEVPLTSIIAIDPRTGLEM